MSARLLLWIMTTLASQLTKIKHNLASLSDDELITAHTEAVRLFEENPDSEARQNVAYLYDDTLGTMAYLDPERALVCYQRILEREDIESDTAAFVPLGLVELTIVIDERTLPLWEQAFKHWPETQECAALAADRVLAASKAFPISEPTTERLQALIS